MEGQRLAAATPYVLPRRDALYWFTCRWPSEVLEVSLPGDLAARDRELLEMALTRIEAAVPGVELRAVADPAEADITITVGADDAAGSGLTGADCAVDLGDGEVAAVLVRAEVVLQRSNESVLGKAIPLSEAEWLGAAIHELGHALGLQGHVPGGPLTRNVEEVRAVGRRLLAGQPLRAPTLRALYALPSGTLLRRDALAPGRTARLDRLASLAAGRGYRGPYVRVGDRAARLTWSSPEGRVVDAWLPELPRLARRPEDLEIALGPVAESWLGPR